MIPSSTHSQPPPPSWDAANIDIDIVSCQPSSSCPDPSDRVESTNLYRGSFIPEPIVGQDGNGSKTFAFQIPPNVVKGTNLVTVNGVLSLEVSGLRLVPVFSVALTIPTTV